MAWVHSEGLCTAVFSCGFPIVDLVRLPRSILPLPTCCRGGEEALLSEMDVTGQAFEDMQEQRAAAPAAARKDGRQLQADVRADQSPARFHKLLREGEG